MTITNIIQIILLAIMLIGGSVAKLMTKKKVQGLEGVRGFVTKKEEYEVGEIVGKFGEL